MENRSPSFALILIALSAPHFVACRDDDETAGPSSPPAAEAPGDKAAAPRFVATRGAYFGDLHIRTRFSFDAFISGVRTNPDDAHSYARGEPLMHSGGYPIRLRGTPLDFNGSDQQLVRDDFHFAI